MRGWIWMILTTSSRTSRFGNGRLKISDVEQAFPLFWFFLYLYVYYNCFPLLGQASLELQFVIANGEPIIRSTATFRILYVPAPQHRIRYQR
jgi:hypothetical protein